MRDPSSSPKCTNERRGPVQIAIFRRDQGPFKFTDPEESESLHIPQRHGGMIYDLKRPSRYSEARFKSSIKLAVVSITSSNDGMSTLRPVCRLGLLRLLPLVEGQPISDFRLIERSSLARLQ